ncbi:hypothetical protein BGX31_001925, partial [Mortierella sp. GBA43]
GQSDRVCTLVYSPQGDYIATGSRDDIIKLWDTETMACIHTFDHMSPVKSVAFSPQGNLIYSLGYDNTMRLWDVRSGVCRHTYRVHSFEVFDNALSPNGKQIASYSYDNTVRLWNVETGVCDFILKGHQDYLSKVRFSPQGDQVASASGDSTIRLWDTQTGECRQILIGHQERVSSIAFSPQGSQLASGDDNGTLRLWDLRTGKCIRPSTNHHGQVTRIEYSPQGNLVASASDDKSVRLWDSVSGECRAAIEVYARDIDWAVISDIHHLATGCEDGNAQLWRLTDDGDRCSVSLLWSATSASNVLDVMGSKIQDVRGLSAFNERFFKQGGAVGEPKNRQREAMDKLTSMASAVSKFKVPTDRTTDCPATATSVSMGELGMKIKQAKDHLNDIESMVTAFARDTHGHE